MDKQPAVEYVRVPIDALELILDRYTCGDTSNDDESNDSIFELRHAIWLTQIDEADFDYEDDEVLFDREWYPEEDWDDRYVEDGPLGYY